MTKLRCLTKRMSYTWTVPVHTSPMLLPLSNGFSLRTATCDVLCSSCLLPPSYVVDIMGVLWHRSQVCRRAKAFQLFSSFRAKAPKTVSLFVFLHRTIHVCTPMYWHLSLPIGFLKIQCVSSLSALRGLCVLRLHMAPPTGGKMHMQFSNGHVLTSILKLELKSFLYIVGIDNYKSWYWFNDG